MNNLPIERIAVRAASELDSSYAIYKKAADIALLNASADLVIFEAIAISKMDCLAVGGKTPYTDEEGELIETRTYYVFVADSYIIYAYQQNGEEDEVFYIARTMSHKDLDSNGVVEEFTLWLIIQVGGDVSVSKNPQYNG